uniref:Katanin p80 subunit C-terminal domain-containing protein n=4 Tax=Aegilops tauschii TaxID=37682 RepID=A0A452YEU0_AEGTS
MEKSTKYITLDICTSVLPLASNLLESGYDRLERCSSCFQELDKINASLISLTRREGKVGRSARELSLLLHDIFKTPSSV